MDGSTSLTNLRGIGAAVSGLYSRLGIRTVAQLVDYYPRAYDDFSHVVPIAQLQPGTSTTQATITSIVGKYVRRGMHITEAVATDQTGAVRLVWFNQPWRAASIKQSQSYFVSGEFGLQRQQFAIQSPSIELVSSLPINTARVLPIYRETKGLTSAHIRKTLALSLPYIRSLPETLPDWVVQDNQLISRAHAVEQLHFPASSEALDRARLRLGFEEIFDLVLASLLNKYDIMTEQAPPVPFVESVAKDFVKSLPFQLTDAQRRAAWQLYKDMQMTRPMNRLIEGDVGSGKTVVAAMAALMVMHHGHQVALMAPTEILARQHADTLLKLLHPVGLDQHVGLLVGSMTGAQKTLARAAAATGQMRFLVGTQALIQDSVDLHQLELVIIDEQHRFGVDQRKVLMTKAGHMPHVLSLTATPIPRSLALTLYGELDVSILDTKPPGRQPVTTEIHAPTSRATVYAKVKTELDAGRQAFVVTPQIELTDKNDTISTIAAEAVYEKMAKKDFKSYRVGLLHGKLKPAEKNAVMEQFVRHEIDILVTTTVIEVGVDVPNASVMLVEGAERFGLSQIHQLRGRIGRGGHPGVCFLMMSEALAPSARLRALEQTNDGFKLAELDLELRGPGALYGTLQHGELDLRIAKLSDTTLIARARKAAQTFLNRAENPLQYPDLHIRVQRIRAVTSLN